MKGEQPIRAFWVTFQPIKISLAHVRFLKGCCIQAIDEKTAMGIAKIMTEADPATATILPYPAEPRLNPYRDDWGVCPSFCYNPMGCKGRTSCPQRYACSE